MRFSQQQSEAQHGKVWNWHGLGKYFVVSEVLEGEYVHLADGRGRKLAKPKRKKRMHLRPCGAASEELRQALQQGDALDARVREALAILKEN